MNFTALICARGGSKGVPGKNLRVLGDRPLIAWAIARALEVPRITRTIVSTDDPAIAEAAIAAGADVPFLRPADLAQDRSPEWLVWRHALAFLRDADGAYPDGLVVIPPTAPLRRAEDLERCLDAFAEGNADVIVTVTDAHRSPYFNMVTIREDGTAGLVLPPTGPVVRRQDVPEVFDMTTVAYVARPEFVMTQPGMFAGRVRAVHVPLERALDIDTPLDFRLAEWFINGTSK